ncbi:MAG: ATP-dependent metallopeptidase FtsH/Yme1/Tma family protein, partial [Parcubacteria group bacterium]
MQKNTGLLKNVFIFIAVILFVGSVFSLYNISNKTPQVIDIQKMIQEINAGTVQHIVIAGDTLNLTLNDNSTQVMTKEPSESLSALLSNFKVDPAKIDKISIEVQAASGFGYWMQVLLPFLIPFIIVVAFIWFMTRQVQGANMRAMSFGQTKARQTKNDGKNRITFKDVAGVKEAK